MRAKMGVGGAELLFKDSGLYETYTLTLRDALPSGNCIQCIHTPTICRDIE